MDYYFWPHRSIEILAANTAIVDAYGIQMHRCILG